MSLPPWHRSFDETTASLTVTDEGGAVQAVVRLELPPDPTDPDGPTGTRVLSRMQGALYRSATNAAQKRWVERRGVLHIGGTATVELPDGSAGSVVNGEVHGLRRVHRTGTVELRGRTYTVRHRSRRRTRITREGLELGTLRRTGWYWRKPSGDGPLRCRAHLDRSMMDGGDLLAAVLAAAVCGPPGRPGGLAELAKELSV